jgi:hypothetical protein
VRGLLLGQGVAWLVLAAAGLPAWIVSFPRGLSFGSGGAAVLWTGAELLGVAAAACIGAAQVAMACRMSGGPRLVLALATSLRRLMLAVSLMLAAFLVMVGGGMLELMALGGLHQLVHGHWAVAGLG